MGKLKQKTHRGTKKNFILRNSGSVKYKKKGSGHLTSKKATKKIRNLRKAQELSKADSKRLKRLIDRMR